MIDNLILIIELVSDMSRINKLIKMHIQQLIQPYYNPKIPSKNMYPALDRHISSYFKQHKSLGSSQRRQIYDKVYDLIRYHTFLQHLCKGNTSLDYRLNLLNDSSFYTQRDNKKLSKWIRCSFPKQLYEKIEQSISDQFQTFQLCKAMNTRAPLTLRINPNKTTRSDLMKKLSKFMNIDFIPTDISPYGVKVPSNKNVVLQQTKQFQAGHFQIQDQASQLAALQVKCKPGDIVLDYCSGSGGKSLAIAHLLEGKGQLVLHEVREKALLNAKHRFQRAGITNVQFHSDQSKLRQYLSHKADWIILDVPCTGSGTIRRNPDIKLRYSQQWLSHNVLLQQKIMSDAIKYLKRNGKIVYITCSLFSQENQFQVKKFMKTHNLQIVDNRILKTKTEKNGMDSMFAAVLTPIRNKPSQEN